MKRMIPFLALACVAVACQQDGPTVPSLDPQFAKPDCEADPSHPSCKGGDGGDGAYTAKRLGKPKALSKAFDLSEPIEGDALFIAGQSEQANGDPIAALWTVQGTNVVETQLDQGEFSVSSARGINDIGSIVVGLVGSEMGGVGNDHILDEQPRMWKASGDGGWTLEVLSLVAPYDDLGLARDANDTGDIAGASRDLSQFSHATVWDGNTGALKDWLHSFDPEGSSEAYAINNQGYVVGFGTTENVNGAPWHALLWRPDGTYCDLHELAGWGEETKSIAKGISDKLVDGTVLAVGAVITQGDAVIWQGDPDDCVTIHVLPETPVSEPRGVSLNGEVVGKTKTGKGQPTRFQLPSTLSVLDDAPGHALEVNRAGQIVGWIQAKGTTLAMLWTPNPTQ